MSHLEIAMKVEQNDDFATIPHIRELRKTTSMFSFQISRLSF